MSKSSHDIYHEYKERSIDLLQKILNKPCKNEENIKTDTKLKYKNGNIGDFDGLINFLNLSDINDNVKGKLHEVYKILTVNPTVKPQPQIVPGPPQPPQPKPPQPQPPLPQPQTKPQTKPKSPTLLGITSSATS